MRYGNYNYEYVLAWYCIVLAKIHVTGKMTESWCLINPETGEHSTTYTSYAELDTAIEEGVWNSFIYRAIADARHSTLGQTFLGAFICDKCGQACWWNKELCPKSTIGKSFKYSMKGKI